MKGDDFMLKKILMMILCLGLWAAMLVSCGKYSEEEKKDEIPEKIHELPPATAACIEVSPCQFEMGYITDNYDYSVASEKEGAIKLFDYPLLVQMFLHRYEEGHKYRVVICASFRTDGLREKDFLDVCESEQIDLPAMCPLHDDFNDRYGDRYYGELTAKQIFALYENGVMVRYAGLSDKVEKKEEWNGIYDEYIKTWNIEDIPDLSAEYLNYISENDSYFHLKNDDTLLVYSQFNFFLPENPENGAEYYSYDLSEYLSEHKATVEAVDESVMNDPSADAIGVFVKKNE